MKIKRMNNIQEVFLESINPGEVFYWNNTFYMRGRARSLCTCPDGLIPVVKLADGGIIALDPRTFVYPCKEAYLNVDTSEVK